MHISARVPTYRRNGRITYIVFRIPSSRYRFVKTGDKHCNRKKYFSEREERQCLSLLVPVQQNPCKTSITTKIITTRLSVIQSINRPEILQRQTTTNKFPCPTSSFYFEFTIFAKNNKVFWVNSTPKLSLFLLFSFKNLKPCNESYPPRCCRPISATWNAIRR